MFSKLFQQNTQYTSNINLTDCLRDLFVEHQNTIQYGNNLFSILDLAFGMTCLF